MLTNTHGGAGGDEAALDELRADARARLVEVVADRHAQRHHAPVAASAAARCRSRSVVAMIGACGRSADSRRAVVPPRVTATIACAALRSASVTAASHSACA